MGKSKKKTYDTIVVKFIVRLKKLDHLPLSCTNSLLYVGWKRGLKAENKGETDRVRCKEKSVFLNEKIEVNCTLIQDAETKLWKTKEKDLVLRLFSGSKKVGKGKKKKEKENEEEGKGLKWSEVGGIQINLVDYVKQESKGKEVFSLTNESPSPTLELRVKAEHIKFNGDNLLVAEDPEQERKQAEKEEKEEQKRLQKEERQRRKEDKKKAKEEAKEKKKAEKERKKAEKGKGKGKEEEEEESEEEESEEESEEEETEEVTELLSSEEETSMDEVTEGWKQKPTKMIGGKKYFCRTASENSDLVDTTLCTSMATDDEEEEEDEEEGDVFEEGDREINTHSGRSLRIYLEDTYIQAAQPDIPVEHIVNLYESVMYCIFLPVFGAETLTSSPQILIADFKEGLGVTAKNHDDLIDRVAPSSDFDNVLLLFEVQLKIVKQHYYYKKENFLNPEGYKQWVKKEEKRINDLIALIKSQQPRLVASKELPSQMRTKTYHSLFRYLCKALFWLESRRCDIEQFDSLDGSETFLSEGSYWLLEEFGERYQVNKLFRLLCLLDVQTAHLLPNLGRLRTLYHTYMEIREMVLTDGEIDPLVTRAEFQFCKSILGQLKETVETHISNFFIFYSPGTGYEGLGTLLKIAKDVYENAVRFEIEDKILIDGLKTFSDAIFQWVKLGISNQYISMLTTAKEMAAKREKGGGKGKRKEEEYDERLNCRELMVLCDLIKSDMEHVTGFGEVFVDYFNVVALTARGFSKLFFEDFADSLTEMNGGDDVPTSKQVLLVGKKVEQLNLIFDEKMPNFQPMALSDLLTPHVHQYLQELSLFLNNYIRKYAKKSSFRPKTSPSKGFSEGLWGAVETGWKFIEEYNYLEEEGRGVGMELEREFGRVVLGRVGGGFFCDVMGILVVSFFPVKDVEKLRKVGRFRCAPLVFLKEETAGPLSLAKEKEREKEREREREKWGEGGGGGKGQGHDPFLVLEIMKDLKAIKISKDEGEQGEEGEEGEERRTTKRGKKIIKKESRELGGVVCGGLNGVEEVLRLVVGMVEEKGMGKGGAAAAQRIELCLDGLVQMSVAWVLVELHGALKPAINYTVKKAAKAKKKAFTSRPLDQFLQGSFDTQLEVFKRHLTPSLRTKILQMLWSNVLLDIKTILQKGDTAPPEKYVNRAEEAARKVMTKMAQNGGPPKMEKELLKTFKSLK